MNLNFFRSAKNKMIRPSTKIYRKQIIEGVSIPAIIHNVQYHFVDLDVYENGRIECWNFKDFDHFKKNVNEGWVVLNIPDGKEISIYGLGNWTIRDGSWIFNKENFIDYVLSLVKELNPKMENIYKFSEKKINGVTIGEDGRGTIYKEHKKVPHDIFPEKFNGKGINLFHKINEDYYLVRVILFSDDSITISRLQESFDLNILKFEELINDGVFLTEIPQNAKVHIYGLGSFVASEALFVTSIENKLIEIKDIQRDLRGEPSTVDICRKAYNEYLKNPTLEQKEILKLSYENVPDHQKMYVGDMDTKDIAVRMIIYGEQEIENWSHYQVSKSMGIKLPTINLPKLKDETSD